MAEFRKKLYFVYHGLKQRCLNPHSTIYRYYGGRGIKLEWETFEDFYNDMSKGYKIGLTIERIDNDGNYSKENCTWATRKEQANNRRTNRNFTFRGVIHTLAQWSEILGIKRSTLAQRFYVYHWSIDQCFERKVRQIG